MCWPPLSDQDFCFAFSPSSTSRRMASERETFVAENAMREMGMINTEDDVRAQLHRIHDCNANRP
jgi:hypothetical protein